MTFLDFLHRRECRKRRRYEKSCSWLCDRFIQPGHNLEKQIFAFFKILKEFVEKCLTIHRIRYILAKQVADETTRNQQKRYGILAQLGEHLPYKQRVIGSSPIGPIYMAR